MKILKQIINIISIIILISLLLMSCNLQTYSGKSYSGKYVLSDEFQENELIIQHENDSLYLTLEGGGNNAFGDATSATCTIYAKGIVKPDTITAYFVDFDYENDRVNYDSLNSENREIILILQDSIVKILFVDSFGYCGLNSSFEGDYLRK